MTIHPASSGTLGRRWWCVPAALALVLTGVAVPAAEANETVTVRGTLAQLVMDTGSEHDGTDQVLSMLEVDGELTALPDDQQIAGRSGDLVELQVSGALQDVQQGDLAAADVVGSVQVTALPSTTGSMSTGDHSLLVLPVYWGSAPSTPTVQTLAGVAQQTIDYWRTQGGGAARWTAQVESWRQVAAPSSCSNAELADLANNAKAAFGVTSAEHQHVLVYFPRWSSCSWAGLGSVPGTLVYVNGYPNVEVWAHEIGHNLGLGHANSLTCGSGVARVALSSFASCTATEYGDQSDVMGSSFLTGAAPNLSAALGRTIGYADVTAASAGVAASLAAPPGTGSVRGVSFPVADGTVVVDYRPAVAPDTRRTAWAGVQVRLVRVDPVYGYATAYLLDMSPGTATAFASPALPLGSSWQVPGTGLSVAVDALGSTAQVHVTSGVVHDPQGSLEQVVATPGLVTVAGWALDVDATGGASVEVSVDSAVATTAPASSVRSDVAGGAVPAGFSLTAPLSSGSHLVCVRVLDDQRPGVAADLGCRTVGVADRRAASAGTGVVATTPVRLMDSWTVSASTTVACAAVTDVGVPATATGVLVNATTAGPSSVGNLVVFPDDGSGHPTPPLASSVNFEPGADVAGFAWVAVGAQGRICWSGQGSASLRVVLDVSGYSTADSGVVLQNATRLMDTRSSSQVGSQGSIAPRSATRVRVLGAAGVPGSGVAAVVVTATVVNPGSVGNLRLYPGGQDVVPTVSTVNYAVGQTKATTTVVPVGADGTVALYSDTPGGPVDVVVDVTGYVLTGGAAYTPVTPTRLLDTRSGVLGTLFARQVVSWNARAAAAVPSGAAALVLVVTAVHPSTGGNLAVFPGTAGYTPGTTSNLNYIVGRDIPNLVVVPLADDGSLGLYSDQLSGSADVVVDLVGYVPRRS